MQRQIIYLVNPISGTKSKQAILQYISLTTSQLGIPYLIKETNATGHYTWLKELVHTGQYTDVVIIGGDGTVNQIVAAVGHLNITIGIIPCGSGNGLAYTAGIPNNYRKALDIVLTGKCTLIDAYTINNTIACHLSGIGFDAQVAHDFAGKKSRGLLTYITETIKNYIKAKPFTYQLLIGHTTLQVQAYFITIANSNQFGNHVTIAPHASLQDGLLDIVVMQKASKLAIPFIMWKQIKGHNKIQPITQNIATQKIINIQAAELIIHNYNNAPLHIDGEVTATSNTIVVKILPQYFKLWVSK